MNIKFLSTIIFLLPTVVSAQTQLGYTNETVSRSNIFRYTSNTDQRLAMRLGPDKLKALAGHTIKGIRMAFGSKNSANNQATLFLTANLQADPICQQTVTITSTNKFTEYVLNQPYTITGQETELFVGCTLDIAASYGPFSSDFSKDLKGTFFAYADGQWTDLYGKGYGCPNMEIVLEDNVQLTDAVLKTNEMGQYVKEREPMDFNLQLQNFGTTSITSFQARVSVGEKSSQVVSFTGLNIAPHKTYDFLLKDVMALTTGQQDLRVELTDINGQTDDDISDNATTASAFFYPADMQKNVLLEVFTGQTCSNCPSGHSSLTSAINQLPDVHVVEIAHHAGFVTDIFSMKEDWTLTGLYNGATYAPAAMFNRLSPQAEASPVQDCQIVSDNVTHLQHASKEHPYVSIALDSRYDEATREVTLQCRFHTHEAMPGQDHRYSIWLVQDGLVAKQAGGSTNYVHNAVSRGCLTNSVWGDAAEFTPGKTLEVTKTFTLPDVIYSTSYEKDDEKNAIATVLKDMKMVVFVHQHSNTDVSACQVFNCAEVALNDSYLQGGFPMDEVARDRVLLRQTYYGDTQGYADSLQATRTLDYCYNADNQLLRKIETCKDSDGDNWQLNHYYRYDYNEHGQLSRSNSLQYGVFDYDMLNFMAANDTVAYEYNAQGQLTKEMHPLKYYTYEYNAQGQLEKRLTFNINSISHQASNDLVETFGDFNAQGNPCTVTATSPTGKEWNEYRGAYTYDTDGNLLEKKHFSTDGENRLKYAEYWVYENGMLTEHRLPTVYDDGVEQENEREVFTPVDGNPDRIQHEVLQYNGDGTWSKMAGSLCIDEYVYLVKGKSPQLMLVEMDGGINSIGLLVSGKQDSNVRFYRSGINVGMVAIYETFPMENTSITGWMTTDLSVRNGQYEYMAVLDGKASTLVNYSFETPLPAVSNLHVVSTRKDFEGNTFVTLGWQNPDFEIMPYVTLPFQSNQVFFENMRIAEATTDDDTVTSLEVNFGSKQQCTLYVQTRYGIGYINSEVLSVDLNNLPDGISATGCDFTGDETGIYDLAGRRVAQPRRGIYIQQGKKVVR